MVAQLNLNSRPSLPPGLLEEDLLAQRAAIGCTLDVLPADRYWGITKFLESSVPSFAGEAAAHTQGTHEHDHTISILHMLLIAVTISLTLRFCLCTTVVVMIGTYAIVRLRDIVVSRTKILLVKGCSSMKDMMSLRLSFGQRLHLQLLKWRWRQCWQLGFLWVIFSVLLDDFC
jgi:hypothetical protein